MPINITVEADVKPYEKARTLIGWNVSDTELIQDALTTFIRIKAARRLADLGGTQPDFEDVPRRR